MKAVKCKENSRTTPTCSEYLGWNENLLPCSLTTKSKGTTSPCRKTLPFWTWLAAWPWFQASEVYKSHSISHTIPNHLVVHFAPNPLPSHVAVNERWPCSLFECWYQQAMPVYSSRVPLGISSSQQRKYLDASLASLALWICISEEIY